MYLLCDLVMTMWLGCIAILSMIILQLNRNTREGRHMINYNQE